MNKIAFEDLLKRYLANNCSDKERLLVEKLYELLGEEKNLVLENIDNLEDELWNRIKLKTDLKEKSIQEDQATILSLNPWYKRASWLAVASILLLISLGIGWFLQEPLNSELTHQESFNLQKNIINNDQIQKTIWLEDSTKITLSPKSKINIPSTFEGLDKREVYLTGEAIFDVSKNPNKPFLVYTGDIVTRVIGTSFKITDKGDEDNVEVVVLSGKVSVYNKEKGQKKQKKINNGVVLVPNQKVIYHSKNKQFVTAVVDEPILLPIENNNNSEPTFIYKETPIYLVLEQLEKNYGIQIEVVENELFMNCPLTANLSKQSLFDKLEMICTSLNATYEKKGTIILINGKGCN